MAHDTEIQEKLDRLETLLTQLEAGELSVCEAERLHEEGHQLLDECRTFIAHGESEIIERKT